MLTEINNLRLPHGLTYKRSVDQNERFARPKNTLISHICAQKWLEQPQRTYGTSSHHAASLLHPARTDRFKARRHDRGLWRNSAQNAPAIYFNERAFHETQYIQAPPGLSTLNDSHHVHSHIYP